MWWAVKPVTRTLAEPVGMSRSARTVSWLPEASESYFEITLISETRPASRSAGSTAATPGILAARAAIR